MYIFYVNICLKYIYIYIYIYNKIKDINENKKKKSIDVIDLTDDTNDDDVKIISSTYNKIENPNKRARLVETITRSNNINSYNSLNDGKLNIFGLSLYIAIFSYLIT